MTTETLSIAPNEFEIQRVFNDEVFADAHGSPWVSARRGNRLRFILFYRNLTGDRRADLWGVVMEARGMQNRIRLPMDTLSIDYSANIRRGAGGGTPQLSSAAVAGQTTLPIDGATSVTDWLKRGDFVSIGNELKLVTSDLTTVSTAGTIEVWPEVHQAYVDSTAVEIDNPHGDFFLVDEQGLGGAPFPGDWINRTVSLTLEADIAA